MSSRSRNVRGCCTRLGALGLSLSLAADARELRVCADPANLPYSDAAGQGFKNRIASLVAADMNGTLAYYWLPQWRGFTRKTLLEGHCDVTPGVPADQPNVRVTNVVGFPVVGATPVAERMVTALAQDEIDVAVVFSPLAGYFIERTQAPLSMVMLEADDRDSAFGFDTAMGVRPEDLSLQRALDASLARLRPRIEAVLREYAVIRPEPASSRETPR